MLFSLLRALFDLFTQQLWFRGHVSNLNDYPRLPSSIKVGYIDGGNEQKQKKVRASNNPQDGTRNKAWMTEISIGKTKYTTYSQEKKSVSKWFTCRGWK